LKTDQLVKIASHVNKLIQKQLVMSMQTNSCYYYYYYARMES